MPVCCECLYQILVPTLKNTLKQKLNFQKLHWRSFRIIYDTAPFETKNNMVQALNKDGPELAINRLSVDDVIGHFITSNKMYFFNINCLPRIFLINNIRSWAANETFNKYKDLVKSMRVVNYIVEHRLVLMVAYNKLHTTKPAKTVVVISSKGLPEQIF